MASTTESGHAQNVANFETLITGVTSLGRAYNPANPGISASALTGSLTEAKTSLSVLDSAEAAYKTAMSARDALFSPFSKLVTRIANALRASDTTKEIDESGMSLIRKLQGRRATPKLTAEEKAALAAQGKEVVEISSSQMGYDNRLENFNKLIQLLLSTAAYNPNESDLKVTALTSLYNDLMVKNTAVKTAGITLNNARIVRNELIYNDSTGIVSLSIDVKNYIKSVFGATSPQFKLISGLKFTSHK
jgi:hypothetical protein